MHLHFFQVHCLWLTSASVDTVARTAVAQCACPNSELAAQTVLTHLNSLQVCFVEQQQAGEGLAALPQLLQSRVHCFLLQGSLAAFVQCHYTSSMCGPLQEQLLGQSLVPDVQTAAAQA
jgi:hypothetical protein